MIKFFIFICTVVFLVVLFFLGIFWSIKKTVKKTPLVTSTFNCENTIEHDLKKLIKSNPDSDIIVVDLGSEDDTLKIIRKLSYKYNALRVIALNEKMEEDIIYKTTK